MRKTEFANGEYYHIYNRGVDKRQVFMDDYDYKRFLISIILSNDIQDGLIDRWRNLKRSDPEASFQNFRRLSLRKPLIDIVAYCFNPNHYHIILGQLVERGIEIFMHRLGTAYTMYFNKRHKRSGSLFQGSFKAIHIDSNEYLLYLSAYVNKNYFIHDLSKNEWNYTSLNEYENKINKEYAVCRPEIILNQFKDIKEYVEYVDKNAIFLKNKKDDRKYLIEED